MRIFLFLLLLVIVVAFIVTFSTNNPDPVTLNYYGLPAEGLTMPLWQIILATFLVGLVIGAIFFALSTVKAKTQLARTRRKLARSERDLEVHGPAPVRNDPI